MIHVLTAAKLLSTASSHLALQLSLKKILKQKKNYVLNLMCHTSSTVIYT